MFKSKTTATCALAACFVLSSTASGAQPITVTSGSDSGSGSLRAALEAAAAQGGGVVAIAPGINVEIVTTLEYGGTGALTILGHGQAVSTKNNVTLLALTQGASLTIDDLAFHGPGGFSIENRGDLEGAAGKGIFIDVRDDQEGTVKLDLNEVIVSGVANHGIHVSDCNLADECGGGGGGEGDGSPASIAVRLAGVTVYDVGNGKFDADGFRVDERGAGSISLSATGSRFHLVGADGIELDEGQAGDVFAAVTGTSFVGNGIYCNPDLLASFLPDPDEAEFEDGEMSEDAIPGPVTGSPDDGCFEREVDTYGSGSVEAYEFGIDLDDGFDIDEAGEGSITASLVGTSIDANLDEGIDFDEEGAGDILFSIMASNAYDNTDDGFKMTEEDDGGVFGEVLGSRSVGNGGKGFVFESEGDGGLKVEIAATATANNGDGDDTGIEAFNQGEIQGTLQISNSDIADGFDLDGVAVVED